MRKYDHYYRAVSFLEGLSNMPLKEDYMVSSDRSIVFIKRMRYLLNLLGDPDKHFKFIHITGTAGKGTVTNMVHQALHASGKKVGSFTSPFVSTSIEKIKVAGKYISPDEFAEIVEDLKPFLDEAHKNGPYGSPSYFEIFLAIALIYFKKKKCDYVILEAGLGGRYDATNVINNPLITAITNVDYDHMELLGRTLKKIAYDKAGIIKRGSIFFTSEQRPDLLSLFQKICRGKRVKMEKVAASRDYKSQNKDLAAAICRELEIEERFIKKGIENARLPGRFEIVQKKPIVVLDGAHNRAKVRSTITNLQKIKFDRLHLVLGIASSKDYAPMLEQIVPLADKIYFSRFQILERECVPPKELLRTSRIYLKKGSRTDLFLDPEVALEKALKEAEQNDLILVTGSFFLVRELRKKWRPEVSILHKRQSF